jgi:hypothetical protein
MRIFVLLTTTVAIFWSLFAAAAAIDPGFAFRTQQFVQNVVDRAI